MHKPRKADMELLRSVGRCLAGRRHVGAFVGAGIGLDYLLCAPRPAGLRGRQENRSGRIVTWNGQVLPMGSSTQAGVPAWSSAEAELKAAIAGEAKMT